MGATLAGSFDSKLSKMRAFSDRLLTALGPGALGNASPRISESFLFWHSFKINTDVNEYAIDWGNRDPYILVFVNLLHSFSTVTLCHTFRDTSAAMSKLRS